MRRQRVERRGVVKQIGTLVLGGSIASLAGCAENTQTSETPASSETTTPTETAEPTDTPTPTASATPTPTATPTEQTIIEGGATLQVDNSAHTATATWTDEGTADYVTVTFNPAEGDAVEKRIDSVDASVTYEGTEGESVAVTVTLHNDDGSMVVTERTIDF